MDRHRSRRTTPLVIVALLLLVGGLAVEVHIRGKESEARASLGGAFRRGTLPDTAGEHVREAFEEARLRAWRGELTAAATLLDRTATQAPAFETHALAARVHRAAGDVESAARHAEFAARLRPDDADAAREAERMLGLALLARARPFARGAAAGSAALLVLLTLVGLGRRRRRRARRRYLDGLSASVTFGVDGESRATEALIQPDSESLVVDVFLRGRYGMARPEAPGKGPSLHLSFSNARANETVRVTPVKDVRTDAVRLCVRDETLARLRSRPGLWRAQVRIGDRMVAVASVRVLSVAGASAEPTGRLRAIS